jgi:hypothetical protein
MLVYGELHSIGPLAVEETVVLVDVVIDVLVED